MPQHHNQQRANQADGPPVAHSHEAQKFLVDTACFNANGRGTTVRRILVASPGDRRANITSG